MRRVLMWLTLAGLCVLGCFAYLFQVPLYWRVAHAVEHHVEVSELGEPIMECAELKTCVPGWRCDEKNQLFAARSENERILAFTSGAPFVFFFVLVGSNGHVKQAVHCGS